MARPSSGISALTAFGLGLIVFWSCGDSPTEPPIQPPPRVDTVIVTDTLVIVDTLVVTDTVVVTDTLVVTDTVTVERVDTVTVTDTITIRVPWPLPGPNVTGTGEDVKRLSVSAGRNVCTSSVSGNNGSSGRPAHVSVWLYSPGDNRDLLVNEIATSGTYRKVVTIERSGTALVEVSAAASGRWQVTCVRS